MNYYIKIDIPLENVVTSSEKKNAFKLFLLKSFGGILKAIIPQANPDYEKKIDDVKFWLLEFDDENTYPVREVGLDENQRSIVKMPYKRNYGYWTDNELKIEDFRKSFNTEIIEKDYFIKKWNDLT